MAPKKRSRGGKSSAAVVIFALALGIFTLLLTLEMNFDIFPFIDINLEQPYRNAVLILAVIFFVWFALRLIGYLIEIAAAPRMGSYGYVRSTWKIISYAIWALVLGVLFFYSTGGLDNMLLSIGLIGAALTFVLQKPLLNMLGWILITSNRMYTIGDRISMGETKGYVTDIMAMNTELYETGSWMGGEMTFTGRVALVPNGMVFDRPVYNYTRDSPYIWDEVTNLVTFESDIDRAKQHMLDAAVEVVGEYMAKNHADYVRHVELHDIDEFILSVPTVKVNRRESGMMLSVIYWTAVDRRRKAHSDITERVWRKFSQDPAVEIAYPHMEVVRHEKP